MITPPKTILFDLDGTLIDSTSAIVQGFQSTFGDLQLPIPDGDAITRLIGYPVADMLRLLGCPPETIQKGRERYAHHYKLISRPQTTLLPYAKEAIALASTFAKVGIVTTKTSANSWPLLEHLQVASYFQCIIGFEDVTHAKPHKEPILKAMKILEATPQNSWMIGDTKFDTQSAKNAGISSVGVLAGYGDREELAKEATHICGNALEAVEYIQTQKP